MHSFSHNETCCATSEQITSAGQYHDKSDPHCTLILVHLWYLSVLGVPASICLRDAASQELSATLGYPFPGRKPSSRHARRRESQRSSGSCTGFKRDQQLSNCHRPSMNVHVRGFIALAGALGSSSIETTCPDDPLTFAVALEYCGLRPSKNTSSSAR
jgi:hypothetical protein